MILRQGGGRTEGSAVSPVMMSAHISELFWCCTSKAVSSVSPVTFSTASRCIPYRSRYLGLFYETCSKNTNILQEHWPGDITTWTKDVSTFQKS